MINRNVIIISSIDWATHWQMHQQLATSLVAAGNRVLFVENTGVRGPRFEDIGRVRERIINWFKSARGFREIQPDLTVFFPLFLPFPYSRLAGWINRFMLSRSVSKWMRIARFHDPVVFTFLPTPLAQALVHDVDPALVIYYCVDNMAGSSSAVYKLRPWEDLLFSRANLVFVTSEAIRERAAIHAQDVHVFPSGVDFVKFATAIKRASTPDDMASLPRPVVGYVGALSGVLDQDLLLEMATQMPSVTFALVGPPYTDVSRLGTFSNIKLLGARSHDQIPAYIKGFDVALIPYLRTSFTESVYSCKLNEYLAMGVPVVSTNIREVRAFAEQFLDVVTIGQDSADFIAKVKLALDDPQIQSQSMRDKRIAVAEENTWDKRFAGIMDVLDKHLLLKSQAPASWKESLIKYYRRSRARWLIRTAFVVCLYLLIFHTPLVWFAGDQLVVKHTPQPVDSIVVFSGDGESTYLNASYQRRALDAARFYKQGYAPIIFLSSGKEQTISEVEVIRLFLVDKGVPHSAIHVLDKYPSSTYQNVVMVSQMLKSQGARSILFLTSPYHGRRALWLWRKQAPDIAVLAPAVMDTPPSNPRWSATVDQIKAIAYEYAAIAYNYMKGWL